MTIAIFDLDGTLANTLSDLADAVNYGLSQLGYPEHEYERYKMFVGNGVPKLCLRALPEDKKDDANKLLELFSHYYESHLLDKTALYPGIREALRKLVENNVELAVATNKTHLFSVKIVNELLSEFSFIKVLGGCEERAKKPDPEIIREILRERSNADRVFMVGDSGVDMQTAKNAGITSIGCTWGFRTRQELEENGAEFIAEQASDIPDIILAE